MTYFLRSNLIHKDKAMIVKTVNKEIYPLLRHITMVQCNIVCGH